MKLSSAFELRVTLRRMLGALSRFAVFPLALALCGLPLIGSRPSLAWQHGTIMDITGGSAQVALQNKVKNKKFNKRKYTWEYNIDDGCSLILAQYRGPKPIPLDKGGLVSFAISGDDIFLRDYRGKPHRLDLLSEKAKAVAR